MKDETSSEKGSKEQILREICDDLTEIESDWEKRRHLIQRIAKEVGKRAEDEPLSHVACEKIGKSLAIQV
jgi:hypothetical protein